MDKELLKDYRDLKQLKERYSDRSKYKPFISMIPPEPTEEELKNVVNPFRLDNND